jgi:hypothetical protein
MLRELNLPASILQRPTSELPFDHTSSDPTKPSQTPHPGYFRTVLGAKLREKIHTRLMCRFASRKILEHPRGYFKSCSRQPAAAAAAAAAGVVTIVPRETIPASWGR